MALQLHVIRLLAGMGGRSHCLTPIPVHLLGVQPGIYAGNYD
jgi:hypothetical protein